jgi:hypothetical protein
MHTIIPPEFIASYFLFYLKVLVLSTLTLYHPYSLKSILLDPRILIGLDNGWTHTSDDE